MGYSILDYLKDKHHLDIPFSNQPNWKLWVFVLIITAIMVWALPAFLGKLLIIAAILGFIIEYFRYRYSKKGLNR